MILRLSSVLDRLPKDAPKTVIIHLPLFIENPNEEKASEKNHSMPPKFRHELLQIFQDNNIDFVFSGENSYILTIHNFKLHCICTSVFLKFFPLNFL